MTPKEKAKELVHRYYLPHPFQKLSKQFALTNVDEIINTIQPHLSTAWWQEVKQEIEKL